MNLLVLGPDCWQRQMNDVNMFLSWVKSKEGLNIMQNTKIFRGVLCFGRPNNAFSQFLDDTKVHFKVAKLWVIILKFNNKNYGSKIFKEVKKTEA